MRFNTNELYQIRDRVARYGQPMVPLTPLGSLELIDQCLNTMKERDEISASLDRLKHSRDTSADTLQQVSVALGKKTGESTLDAAKRVAAESTGLYSYKCRVREALGMGKGVDAADEIRKLRNKVEENDAPSKVVLHNVKVALGMPPDADAVQKVKELVERLRKAETGPHPLDEANRESTFTDFAFGLHNALGSPEGLRGIKGMKWWIALLEYVKERKWDYSRERAYAVFYKSQAEANSKKLKALEADSITPTQFAAKAIGRIPPALGTMCSYDSQWAGLADHIQTAFNRAFEVQEELKEARIAIDTLSKRFEIQGKDLTSQIKINENAHRELSKAKAMLLDQEKFHAGALKNLFWQNDQLRDENSHLRGALPIDWDKGIKLYLYKCHPLSPGEYYADNPPQVSVGVDK